MAYKRSTRPPELSLGKDDRLMTWSTTLNIYRVNRFHLIDLPDQGNYRTVKKSQHTNFDIIEQLLMRNMVGTVETIFFYVGLESTQECLVVCKLWNEFLSCHLFKRWAEELVNRDESLKDLAVAEKWTNYLGLSPDEVENYSIYRKICHRIFELREVWRYREPKLHRLSCDSFVLCLKFQADHLYCGLNNGSLQLWDMEWNTLKKEQEIHDKGVKCIDTNKTLIATGSYDCKAKIWRLRDWELLRVIDLHLDSVWDLKIRQNTMVTAGLEGTLGMFTLHDEDGSVDVHFLFQVTDEIASSVDFDDSVLVAGFESSNIGIFLLPDHGGPRQIRMLSGHGGGVTGLQLNGNILISSSYDGTVRIWNTESGECLQVLTEPGHFVRCVALIGNILACGDFGGNINLWKIHILDDSSKVAVKSHRHFKAHKGHVVCIQLDARRIVSGSRDKTVLIQNFWAKMIDSQQKKQVKQVGSTKRDYFNPRYSRRSHYHS